MAKARATARWYWIMVPLMSFLALTLAVVALAIQGSAFILLAGSLVCGVQAIEAWRTLRRRLADR